jgi:hypothetical protein
VSRYVLIQSKSPWESEDIGQFYPLARELGQSCMTAVALIRGGKDMATITIGIMDPPYESANTPTAFRFVEAAIRKGNNVNVFCYGGQRALAYAGQKQHPNAVHGMSLEEEDH